MNSIQFPKPGDLINLNDRKHWSHRAAQAKVWRYASFVWVRDAMNRGLFPKTLGPSVVSVTLPVGSLNQRRDPHNFIPTVKAIVDGLVDAGLWPDDNSDWVTVVDPQFQQGGFVTVTLFERSRVDGS